MQRRNTPMSSFNPVRRNGTPLHGGGSQHRSHHVTRVPTPPSFKPNTTIKISRVVEASSHNERRHVGSFIYSPTISTPDIHTPLPTRLNVSIRPNLLPSFRDPDQVNCTYTVRVSRIWLRQAERESICAERFLWGSGIYTDDSDVVAAAIHSGYLKCAWSDWVDTRLLQDIIRDQNPTVDAGQENVPPEPQEPVAGKDLQITLLILPQLERYEQSVRYGLRSRSWPEDTKDALHDGVSLMVLNCEWVDEGSERGQSRSGAARRNRLDNTLARPQMRTGRVANGSSTASSLRQPRTAVAA